MNSHIRSLPEKMISAVVLAKNEQENIADCLSGLGWCDEVIVVDDYSSDKTVEIARKKKVRVIKHELECDFSRQRNFGINQARGDWVFFVDADERVSESLGKEIKREVFKADEKGVNGFYLKRKDIFLGKKLSFGETGNFKILRLAKKGSGEWQRSVDEIWNIRGETRTLKNSLLHFSHPTLAQFLHSINERSTLNAHESYQEGKRLNFIEWNKPLAKFIQNYFLKVGFLDGAYGFVFAVLMSLHSFLVRGKLYLLWKKEGGWK